MREALRAALAEAAATLRGQRGLLTGAVALWLGSLLTAWALDGLSGGSGAIGPWVARIWWLGGTPIVGALLGSSVAAMLDRASSDSPSAPAALRVYRTLGALAASALFLALFVLPVAMVGFDWTGLANPKVWFDGADWRYLPGRQALVLTHFTTPALLGFLASLAAGLALGLPLLAAAAGMVFGGAYSLAVVAVLFGSKTALACAGLLALPAAALPLVALVRTLPLGERGVGDFAGLELRKTRLLFWGLAATFLATLPLGGWLAGMSRMDAYQGVQGALLFWTAAGLPLSALLLGANSGAELRSSASGSAEGLFPLSQRGRVFGAAAGALARFGGLATVILGCFALVNPEFFSSLPLFCLVAALPSAGLVLCSLACAYLLRSGAVGGLAAGLLAVMGAALAHTVGFDPLPKPHGFLGMFPTSYLFAPLVIAAQVAAAPLALAGAASWLERGLKGGWKRGSLAAGLLVTSGLLTGWLAWIAASFFKEGF